MAAGEATGPFHGVPLAHKDMLDRPGRVTGCGSKIRADHVASTQATVLARLDSAGALDMGRLNMSEFALGPTGVNAHHGRSCNPWNPEVITGGSSAGSGAAIASGVAFAAIGSDTGGSIRLPAGICGVAGLKPTQGRISRHGAMPLSFSQDCLGPMAPSVADVAAFYAVIAGPDGLDPTVAQRPVTPAKVRDSLKGLRMGVSEAWLNGADPETLSALRSALKTFESLGAEIVAVTLPDVGEFGELANIVSITEAAAIHGDWLRDRPDDYGPQVRARLRQGAAIPGALYLRAIAMRAPLLENMVAAFGEAHMLVMPNMPILPPKFSEVDGAAGAGGPAGAVAIPAMVASLTRYTRPISYLGLPALTQPVGWSTSGLPIGMQIVGRPFAEAMILSAGMTYETAAGFHRRRLPPMPPLSPAAG